MCFASELYEQEDFFSDRLHQSISELSKNINQYYIFNTHLLPFAMYAIESLNEYLSKNKLENHQAYIYMYQEKWKMKLTGTLVLHRLGVP